MFREILSVIKDHMGTGFVTVLFILSLAYLLFTEKDRVKRCFLVYMPLVVLAFFLCPLSLKIYGKISESVTYYRLLWLIPVTPVIAYAATDVCGLFKGFKRNVCIAGLALLMAVSGRLMYSDMYMVKAANIYHMPQAVVDICDALHVEGREVMAVVPFEMQQFVRQYDPCICMPYGREYMMGISTEVNDLREAMLSPDKDPEEIGTLAAQNGCHYIVLYEYEKFDTPPRYYVEYMTIDGYVIYKSTLLSTEVGLLVVE